jgi:hypothetical protein
MHDAAARRHPLHIPHAVPSRVADRIGVVNNAVHGGGNGFEAAVRVTGKTRNRFTVIHSIVGAGVKVLAVACYGRFHGGVAGRIVVLVIDAEQKRIQRRHGTLRYGPTGQNGGSNNFGHVLVDEHEWYSMDSKSDGC